MKQGRKRERRTSDRSVKLGRGDVPHVADGSSGLDVDHVGLVSKPVLQQVVHLLVNAKKEERGREYQLSFDAFFPLLARTHLGSSSMTFPAYRINMHTAIGFLRTLAALPPFPPLSCWIILVTAILSPCLMRKSSPRAWYWVT